MSDNHENIRDLVHQEIWQTLPEEKENELKELAQQIADEKNIPLYMPVTDEELPDDNKVMMQYFEWYLPDDGEHWNRLRDDAENLKKLGVGGVWLPPFCKSTGTNDVGYGIYDLFDLGEFDQKGNVRTKYGTKDQLKAAIDALHAQGIQAYADAVLNHKAGADEAEVFQVVQVDQSDRNHVQSEPFDIEGWTGFHFPGRQGKYSDFKWNFQHFTAVNFDQRSGNMGIYKILGKDKGFSDQVSGEQGNADYLMFADIDYKNKDVIDEVLHWGEWVTREMNLDGMRMDAVKHIDHRFMEAFIRHVKLTTDRPLYFVAEYWASHHGALDHYLNETDGMTALFDVPLHFNFLTAGQRGRDYDLRTIFDGSLVNSHYFNAATFVDNHDSQPGQALESWVADWFKPLAYALILLREDGYPCVFYGDYYGISGENGIPGKKDILDKLLIARKYQAYGEQVDYFDHANTIGWIRKGLPEHFGSGLACVMSNGEDGFKRMSFGPEKQGTKWCDVTGAIADPVTLNEHGEADFYCKGGSVSVYIQTE